MKSEKSEFLQRLRAILLLEKNGASENTVIQLFHDVIGEDLRATVTGFGYSGISDPDFLDDHSDVIVSLDRNGGFTKLCKEGMLRAILRNRLGSADASC